MLYSFEVVYYYFFNLVARIGLQAIRLRRSCSITHALISVSEWYSFPTSYAFNQLYDFVCVYMYIYSHKLYHMYFFFLNFQAKVKFFYFLEFSFCWTFLSFIFFFPLKFCLNFLQHHVSCMRCHFKDAMGTNSESTLALPATRSEW